MDASYSTVRLTRGEKTIRISLDDLEVRTCTCIPVYVHVYTATGRFLGSTVNYCHVQVTGGGMLRFQSPTIA